jgi:hypothetical protein
MTLKRFDQLLESFWEVSRRRWLKIRSTLNDKQIAAAKQKATENARRRYEAELLAINGGVEEME